MKYRPLGCDGSPKSPNVGLEDAMVDSFNIPTIYKIYMCYIWVISLIYIWVAVKQPQKDR